MYFANCLTACHEWTTPTTTGTPPTPRQGHIVAVIGNRMFVHGGMSGQQIFNDWHILNLGTCMHVRIMYTSQGLFQNFAQGGGGGGGGEGANAKYHN